MKPTRRFVIGCAAVLLSGLPLRAQAPSILEPKVERLQGPPLWISAEAVADEEKIVNLDLIDSPVLVKEVERQLRELRSPSPAEKLGIDGKPPVVPIDPSECQGSLYSSGQSHRGGVGPTASLSDLSLHSQSILQGTIRTISMGFDRGTPASLLSVEVSRAIKGPASQALVYLLYPIAHFRIGPIEFCNTRKGYEPHTGDQILLFDYTGTVDRDHLLLAPRLDQIIFQSQDGTLFLPPQLKKSQDMEKLRSLNEIVGRLRSTAISPSQSKGGVR